MSRLVVGAGLILAGAWSSGAIGDYWATSRWIEDRQVAEVAEVVRAMLAGQGALPVLDPPHAIAGDHLRALARACFWWLPPVRDRIMSVEAQEGP